MDSPITAAARLRVRDDVGMERHERQPSVPQLSHGVEETSTRLEVFTRRRAPVPRILFVSTSMLDLFPQ
jgi:hypothetical protein